MVDAVLPVFFPVRPCGQFSVWRRTQRERRDTHSQGYEKVKPTGMGSSRSTLPSSSPKWSLTKLSRHSAQKSNRPCASLSFCSSVLSCGVAGEGQRSRGGTKDERV